tara:strand:+ start:360 stop:932 length:573 start_codon:yes stop_codon:yes gene_type:complete
MILNLFILLLIFFVIIITLRNHEQFTLNPANPISNNTNYGIHSIVNPNEYNLGYYGPKCLNTCIIEHLQKINWESASKPDSPYAKENILQYNRDNPSESYCHLANLPVSENSSFKDCSHSDCKESCGSDLYSHCNKILNFCSENKLNYLSGGSLLRKTKCSGENNCVDKYWKNIQSLKDFYDDYYTKLID